MQNHHQTARIFRSFIGQGKSTVSIALTVILAAMMVAGCSDESSLKIIVAQPVWTQDLAPEYTHRSVWGVSSSHFFITSEKGAIKRYKDGEWTTWSFEYFHNLRAVWGAGPDQVVVVGEGGQCFEFDGVNWTEKFPDTYDDLLGLWGTSFDNIYAVGEGGVVTHFDGDSWQAIESGVEETLYSIWGFAEDDIYAVGRKGTIIHFDGAVWSTLDSGTINALEAEVRNVLLQLMGDETRAFMGASGPVSISSRMRVAQVGTVLSTYGPTAMHESNLQMAERAFEQVRATINRIVSIDLPALRAQLDAAGVPWTPGRGVSSGD